MPFAHERGCSMKTLCEFCPYFLADWPDVLQVKDLQQILGVGRKEIYRLIAEGKLHAVKVGKGYRVLKMNVAEWLVETTRPAVIELRTD